MVERKAPRKRLGPWIASAAVLIAVILIGIAVSERRGVMPDPVAEAPPPPVERDVATLPAPPAAAPAVTPNIEAQPQADARDEADLEARAPDTSAPVTAAREDDEDEKKAATKPKRTKRETVAKRPAPTEGRAPAVGPPSAETGPGERAPVAANEAPVPARELVEQDEAQARTAAGSPVEIVFREDLNGLETESLELLVDGSPVAIEASAEGLPTDRGLALFRDELPTGAHRLSLRAKLRGDARVFSYLKGYNFTIAHNGTINIPEDRKMRLVISAVQTGGITREWKDRVSLKVDVSSTPIGDMASLEER
jgi:hypothetical protein